MRRFVAGYFLIVFVCIFSLSCSRHNTSSPETNPGYAHSVEAADFAPGQLPAHYLKHGYQFGDITQEQYLKNAQALLNATPGKDVLEKIRPNGDILHYRLSNGEFAVMDRGGRIRTYFKADYQYWIRQ